MDLRKYGEEVIDDLVNKCFDFGEEFGWMKCSGFRSALYEVLDEFIPKRDTHTH